MTPIRPTLAALALAAACCSSAQAIVLSPMLPATGTYSFTGQCLDCQPSGQPSSTASAWLTVDNVYNFSQWTFSYTSRLFPQTLASTRVTGFDSDGQLAGLSVATVYFETAPTLVPNSDRLSSQWVFSTRQDGDLFWDLSPQQQASADFGNDGLWVPPTNAVPEPGALALVGLALAGLLLLRRRA